MRSGQVIFLDGQQTDILCDCCMKPVEYNARFVHLVHQGKLQGIAHLKCANDYISKNNLKVAMLND